MRFVADGLKPQLPANPVTAKLGPSVNALVAGDETTLTRLSQTACDAPEAAKATLAEEIGTHLSKGDLDLDRLSMLLSVRLGTS